MKAVIVVDPASTGANLVQALNKRDVPVVCVWSNNISKEVRAMIQPGVNPEYVAVVQADESNDDITVSKLNDLGITFSSILSGSEPGVELADTLSVKLGLKGNGLDLTHHRRDKYLMSEKIRADGIRAVEQRRCSTWEECVKFIHQQLKRYEQDVHDVKHYLQTTQIICNDHSTTSVVTRQMTVQDDEPLPFQWIIKPARSSGSDGVYKCRTIQQMKDKFDLLIGHQNKLGIMNDCVLVQELLQGDEYVVDTVSRDGVHKLAGAWRYIKGSANGGDFVYFGMVACDGKDPVIQQTYEYTKKVLDSLNIVNGAGHAEVMFDPRTGPCLVEIGARPHGGEGIFVPVAERLFGYSLVDVLADSVFDEAKFLDYPDVPTLHDNGFGAVVDLVCFQKGIVQGTHAETEAKLRGMDCFLDFKCLPEPGTEVEPTVDMFSTVGCVLLATNKYSTVAENQKAVLDDIQHIREFEKTLYIVQ